VYPRSSNPILWRVALMCVSSAAVLACAGGADESAGEAPGGTMPLFVDAAWLSERNGAGGGVALLHVGSPASLDSAHIAGSGFLDVAGLNEERDGVPGMLPPPDRLAASFDAAAVRAGEPLVLYGAPLAAARGFVALEHAGFDAVALLDGGLPAWRAAGLPVTEGGVNGVAADQGAASGSPTARPPAGGAAADGGRVVAWDWVLAKLDDPAAALIDARPPAQYTGEVPGERVPRPGHIPGAANLFWEELSEPGAPGRLLPEAELRARFEAAGATPERVVILYCRTGMQASFAYAVARHLGYDAYIYDGSFVEWSNRPELPVTR
jgi:thiosulfate/3-mercaptopyruvate sulfurtransferase